MNLVLITGVVIWQMINTIGFTRETSYPEQMIWVWVLIFSVGRTVYYFLDQFRHWVIKAMGREVPKNT